MALININTFQDGIDKSKEMMSYTDEYVKQSLANLGQRTGLKGDGFQSGSFFASELVDCTTPPSNSNYYIRAEYDTSADIVTSYLFNPESKEIEGESTVIKFDERYVTTSDITLPVASGEDTAWRKGGYIQMTDTYYVMHFISVRTDGTEYIISEQVSKSGFLSKAFILIPDPDLRTGWSVLCLTPVKDGDYTNYTITDAPAPITGTTSDIFDGIASKTWSELIDYYNTYITDTVSSTSAVTYDGQMFVLTGTTSAPIQRVLTEVSYHIHPWFVRVKDIYNSEVWFNEYNSSAIRKKILASLIKGVWEYVSSNGYSVSTYTVYIPISYKISCLVNSNDDTQILSSEFPIYAYYDDDLIFGTVELQTAYPNSIVAEGPTDKCVAFDFSVGYSSSGIVSLVGVSINMVLPYINSDGFWVVNDKVTPVYGVGRNAGQPNIILSRTTKEDDGTLTGALTYVGNSDDGTVTKLTKPGWVSEKLKYRIPMSNKSENYNTNSERTVLTAVLPSLSNLKNDEDRLYLLTNALIVAFIDVKEDDTLSEVFSGSGTVPTLWTVVNEDNEYKYKYLTATGLEVFTSIDESDFALDTDTILNLEVYVNNLIKSGTFGPDKSTFEYLVFGQISTLLKQQTNVADIPMYPTFRNKRIDYSSIDDADYIDRLEKVGDDSHPYTNPINFVPEFTSSVEFGTEGVRSIPRNSAKRAFTLLDVASYNNTTEHYVRDTIPFSYYPEEIIPNSGGLTETPANKNIYPNINLKEVLIYNANILNRSNVLGLVKSTDWGTGYITSKRYFGKLYYGYFGVSPDGDRDVLRIGTSTHDINMGTAALTYQEETEKMYEFKKLSIDIAETNFGGTVKFGGDVSINKALWKVTPVGSYNIFTATVTPVGMLNDMFYTYTEVDTIGDNEWDYLREGTILSPVTIEKEISYLDVDKFIEQVGFTYGPDLPIRNYTITADSYHYFPSTASGTHNLYKLSTGLKSEMSFECMPTIYTGNPITMSYILGDMVTKESYYVAYTYIYGLRKYNQFTVSDEDWKCGGCTLYSGDASHCSYRGVCKFTTFKYDDPGLNTTYTFASGLYATRTDIVESQSTHSFYSKWAAQKLGIGYVNPNWTPSEYNTVAQKYPSTYSFSYEPQIYPLGGGDIAKAYIPGNYSYYDLSRITMTSYQWTAYINLRENITNIAPVTRKITYYLDITYNPGT